MSDTLTIRNWRKWQSYRSDRGQPPWIKVHRCVMRDPEWVALTDSQRGQLVAMWLLAADRDGVIPASPTLIRKLCFMDEDPDLQLFMAKGFIEPDVTVTSRRRQHDVPEKRRGEKRIRVGNASDTAFEEVWKVCRRGSKKQALVQYRKAVPHKIDHDTLMTQWAEAVRAARSPEFVPHLSRWIRDERWEEDIVAPTNGTQRQLPNPQGFATPEELGLA